MSIVDRNLHRSHGHPAQCRAVPDPVNPGVKNGVFDIHQPPVDPASSSGALEVRLAGQNQGVLGLGRETTAFTVVYDKLKLTASVHSASLPIPKDPTTFTCRCRGAARGPGGNRSAAPLTADVRVPGLYSLSALSIEPLVVDNDRDETRAGACVESIRGDR